jgi:hypothetical protein
MSCCENKPDLIHASKSTPPFKTMEQLHCFTNHWACLVRCKQCDQLWVVDEWDKYANLAAFKVSGIPGKNEIEDLLCKAHERLTVQDVGGLSNAECVWAGCSNKALKGIKVCYQHYK